MLESFTTGGERSVVREHGGRMRGLYTSFPARAIATAGGRARTFGAVPLRLGAAGGEPRGAQSIAIRPR